MINVGDIVSCKGNDSRVYTFPEALVYCKDSFGVTVAVLYKNVNKVNGYFFKENEITIIKKPKFVKEARRLMKLLTTPPFIISNNFTILQLRARLEE